ncbi:hypothetical protein [Bacillus sp. 1A]|uniref:hypothetical protein n=1 Tax=Bacillus sp. 1A TaxID=3461399 RepID=UPI004043E7A3
MFKKLVVGALAAGIVLTGGIGAASAEELTSTKKAESLNVTCGEIYELNDGLYAKYVCHPSGVYANSFEEPTKYGKIKWYLKNIIDGKGYYQGRVVK